MAKAWGAGAWAADAEEADKAAEEEAIAKAMEKAKAPTAFVAGPAKQLEEAFPTLGEAASVKPTKKKKQGKQTMSISELMTGKYVGPGGRSRTEDVPADILYHLPKGPRVREEGEDEMAGGLGGGFKDYGGNRERNRGGFGEARDEEMNMPSRADEARDWGAAKKFVPSAPRDAGRGFGSGGFGDRDRDYERGPREEQGPSRADELDNWGAAKKFVPSGPAPGRDSGRDGWRPGGSSGDVDARDWTAGKRFVPSAAGPPLRSEASADGDRWGRREMPPARDAGPRPSERPRLALAPRTKPVDSPAPEEPAGEGQGGEEQKPKPKANPFGAARPREEVLQHKGQDWKKLDEELEKKGRIGVSPPTSIDGGSRPSTPPVRPKPKVNPFGEAKPREVLLQEKGQDWRKMEFELEHKSVERPDSEEEIKLKKQIKRLSAIVKGETPEEDEEEEAKAEEEEEKVANGESGENAGAGEKGEGEQEDTPAELLAKKEKELEQLTRALDDKVRFSQRGRGAPRKDGEPPLGGRDRSRDLDRPGSSGSGGSRPSSGGPARDRPSTLSGRGGGRDDWGGRGDASGRGGRW